MNRIVIIDGNSLINRAYYAMQRPMITKEGIYTQGIYGFLNMLNKIFDDYDPQYITVAFDRKTPTFRHESYKEYKAGRKKMPPELAMEMPILKDILHAMNITTLEIDGYEADDIIGTVARQCEEEGIAPLIITGDKDALQLCTEITKVLITKKGISEFDIYDYNKMIERYNLTPSQFIDLKGLMGDSSDNIPGIPGVGEKTGIKLLEQFGTVENLITNYEEIKNEKLRLKVEDNAALAMMSKRLATIITNVPIEFQIESLKREDYNLEALQELYIKLEFNSFLKKLNFQAKGQEYEVVSYNTVIINEDLTCLDEIEGMTCGIKLFSDFSHKALPQVFAIGILVENRLYLACFNAEEKVKAVVAKLDSLNLEFYGHGLKDDYYALMQYGLVNVKTAFDTEIAAYLLQPTKSSYSFNDLLAERLYITGVDENEFLANLGQISLLSDDSSSYLDYLAGYFNNLVLLKNHLEEKISQEELSDVFYNVELPLIEVLASMEKEGIKVDLDKLNELGSSFSNKAKELESSIYQLAGEEFNINSPHQLGIILFEKLGLPAGKKTKTGYSTSAEVLDKLKDKSPIIDLVLKYRTVTKLNSTYVVGLKPLLNKHDIVHAHFQQTVTATGRISCTEPNLQNIPVRDFLGRELRKAYVPKDKDHVFIGADYSQIELRVLAHLSQDHELIDAFNHGDDIHKITAAKVLGIPFDEVTKEQRSSAKAVNFGVIYGMSSFGLSEELNISRKEAEKYITDYFKKYATVNSFMKEQVEKTKALGYTTTFIGRRRYINEILSSNYMVRQLGERLAMNTPIQGSAADIIKIAMIKVYNRLKNDQCDAKLILQVHDELILETNIGDKDYVEQLLVETMENAVAMAIPLLCEANTGLSWYELK